MYNSTSERFPDATHSGKRSWAEANRKKNQGDQSHEIATYYVFVVLISFSTFAFAQSQAAAPESDAQNAFTKLKTLAGTWQGRATLEPPNPKMDPGLMQVSLRVTSRGNALVHEM